HVDRRKVGLPHHESMQDVDGRLDDRNPQRGGRDGARSVFACKTKPYGKHRAEERSAPEQPPRLLRSLVLAEPLPGARRAAEPLLEGKAVRFAKTLDGGAPIAHVAGGIGSEAGRVEQVVERVLAGAHVLWEWDPEEKREQRRGILAVERGAPFEHRHV